MKKLLLILGFVMTVAVSVAVARQYSSDESANAAQTQTKECCKPTPNCPAGGDGCCKK